MPLLDKMMALCKIMVSPLLTYWRYCIFVQSCWNINSISFAIMHWRWKLWIHVRYWCALNEPVVGFVQDCGIYSVNTLEIPQCCTRPLWYNLHVPAFLLHSFASRTSVLAVPFLLANMGHVVRSSGQHGQSPRCLQSIHGQHMGLVCCGIHGILHS